MTSVARKKVADKDSSAISTRNTLHRRGLYFSALVSSGRSAPVGTGEKPSSIDLSSFTALFTAEPKERIRLIREGVPAKYVSFLSQTMGISKDSLFVTLGLPKSTIGKKVTKDQVLPKEQGERVLGLAKLVGQVQTMVEASGNPEGFDAPSWVAHWMSTPSNALDGDMPASYMDTVEGQEIVSGLIAKMQSSAYA
ncbi:MAG: antitoxin Xre/MbcA/ParS toxin-binding domain-containing protein [Gallionella sp.]